MTINAAQGDIVRTLIILMNRTMILCFVFLIAAEAFLFADPPPSAAGGSNNQPAGVADPRASQFPVILFHNQKEHKDCIQDALLIFARWDTKPPNQILGVEETFTDEQIIAGLRKFYREWQPPADYLDQPPPQLIFAQQNWGCGGGLYEPIKALSAEFHFDVYQLYPVVIPFKSKAGLVIASDKRLVELIKAP